MTPPTVRLATALVLGCFGLASFAHSQTIANQKVTNGTVSGRVTLKGKGVQGISVALRNVESDQGRPAFVGVTDAQGNYRISNIPPGQYQAAPAAPAFVTVEMTGGGEGKLIFLTEGENVGGIDFSLVKGGVITGKVSDAEGKPVVEESLNVVAVESRVWRSQIIDFRTDDRGVYRVFGLPAGRYKVSVGQDFRMGMPGGRPRRPYKLTFYPDAADASQAAIVEVVEGGETSGVDITVGRFLDGYAASGRIVDGVTGQPLPNVRLGVAQRIQNQHGYVAIRSLSSSRGEFRIEGLRPGEYDLVIGQDEGTPVFADPTPFEIVDRDVDNLVVKTSKGASLSGVVVLDGLSNDKALLAKLHQLRLNIWIQGGPAGSPTWRWTSINSDGSFRLTGLPAGIANVNVLSSSDRELAKGFVVLYTEREGVRLTQGVEIIAGEDTTGLRVVVAHGTAIVRGDVIFVNGTAPPGSRLMVLLTRVGEIASLRSAEVDSRGRFAITGVPAGAYSLQVQGYIPGARNQTAKQQVNVVDAAVTEVTVTLDLNPLPGSRP